MKSLSIWRSGIFGSVILGVWATAALAGSKSAIQDEAQEFKAQVESVDTKNRTLVLKTPSGESEEFSVGPQVRNFEKVKPGDHVVLRYHVGVAAEIKPGGTKAQEMQENVSAEKAPLGGSVGHSISATVMVESVDTSFNTVTFKRADGKVRTVAVDSPKGREFIRKLKKGDAVEITYTEAVAVSLEPGLT